MPDIIQTSLKAGATDAEVNILDASDQFVYQPDADQVMVLRNPTGSAISPVLTGNNVPSAHPVPGVDGYLVMVFQDNKCQTLDDEGVPEYENITEAQLEQLMES